MKIVALLILRAKPCCRVKCPRIGGQCDDFEHTPYHHPHSYPYRCSSDMGPQPRLGIWAVWHCRPHPCSDHCSSSNGQALTGLVFSALCAAAAERSNVHGTFAFQFPACSLRQRAGLVRRSIAEIENPVAGGANQVSIRAVRWGARFNPLFLKCSVDGRPADTLRPRELDYIASPTGQHDTITL